jgi:hypothetical protein
MGISILRDYFQRVSAWHFALNMAITVDIITYFGGSAPMRVTPLHRIPLGERKCSLQGHSPPTSPVKGVRRELTD